MDLKKTIDNIDSSINRIAEGVAKGTTDRRTASKILLNLAKAVDILAIAERENRRSVGVPVERPVTKDEAKKAIEKYIGGEAPPESDKNTTTQKRKRRTKAEIAAEKAAKTAVSGKTEAEVEKEEKPEKDTMAVEISKADIRKMVVEVVEEKGAVKAKELVKKCGADQLSDVPEDKYGYLATLVREALGEDKKDG